MSLTYRPVKCSRSNLEQLQEQQESKEDKYRGFVYIASLLLNQGDLLGAQESLNKAGELYWFDFMIPDELQFEYLSQLFNINILKKQYDNALQLNEIRRSIITDLFGLENLYLARVLLWDARLNAYSSEFKRALAPLNKAINIYELTENSESLEAIEASILLSALLYKIGDSTSAESTINKSIEGLNNLIGLYAIQSTMPEYENQLFKISDLFQKANHLITSDKNTNAQLLAKNLVSINGRSQILQRQINGTIRDNTELSSRKNEIDSLFEINERFKLQDKYDKNLERNLRITERAYLEEAIRKIKMDEPANLSSLESKFNQNEILSQFFITKDILSPSDSEHLSLFLYSKKNKQPNIINLGSLNELLLLLPNTRDANAINKAYSLENIKIIRDFLWGDTKDVINDESQVYIIASGVLNTLPFELLKKGEEEIKRFTSIDDIIKEEDSLNQISRALIFGAVDYESSSINNSEARDVYLSNLPFTKIEIQNVEQILTTNTALEVVIFSGTSATEHSFKSQFPLEEFSLLHVSSHGFYIPQQNSYRVAQFFGSANDVSPMLRSGFVLKEDSEEDGIVTSLEISKMDLSKVGLVVLSACETGLGDISNDEGVFGLQRALKIAGVKQQILSLWRVSDSHTAEFMSLFYTEYAKDKDVNVAFKKSSNKMREIYPEPYYSSPFILIN